MSRARNRRRALTMEWLEGRKLLTINYLSGAVGGTLSLQGTGGHDDFQVTRIIAKGVDGIRVEEVGVGSRFFPIATKPIANIVADLGDGHDNLTVDASVAASLRTALGGAGHDTITGGAGDDTIDGGLGFNTIDGQGGNDLILGGDDAFGADIVFGGDGDDTIYGHAGNDTLYGELGNDEIYGGEESNDLIDGGIGDDLLEGDSGNDTIYGGPGSDTVRGEGGEDWLYGNSIMDFGLGEEADVIEGGDDDDVLHGGVGNDTLSGGIGGDVVYGGDGDDLVEHGEVLIIEPSTGQPAHHYSDVVYGEEGNDTLHGGFGDDLLDGGEGLDKLWGGQDDDILVGGGGADVLNGGEGADQLEGDAGADQLIGHDGKDTLTGGAGDDTLDGGDGDDVLEGENGDDLILAGFGDDTLDGGDGADALYGDVGNDTSTGGVGDDRFLLYHDVVLNADFDDPTIPDFVVSLIDDVTDLGSNDVQVNFRDADAMSETLNGDDVEFTAGAWTDDEVAIIDDALRTLFDLTGNNALLSTSDGGELTFHRLGAGTQTDGNGNIVPTSWPAYNSGEGEMWFSDGIFNSPTGSDRVHQVVFHEVGHNWDEENADWFGFKALSLWLENPLKLEAPAGADYSKSTDGLWFHANDAGFARAYGQTNPKEDFATAFAYFVVDTIGMNNPWTLINDLQPKLDFMSTFVASLA